MDRKLDCQSPAHLVEEPFTMAKNSKHIVTEHRRAIFKEIGLRLRTSISVADEALPENMSRLLLELQAKAQSA